jgi:signal transduction histidine kinase/ActR/RegA family two-component response regulator
VPAALGAALLGLLALVAHITGVDFGLDRVFPVTTLELLSGPHPSRMAPISALLLLLVGGGLAIPGRIPEARRIAQGCAVAALAIAIFLAIGIAFGLFEVAPLGPFRKVSPPTAIATFLLAAGMLSARPADGFMGVFTDTAAGGMLARRLLPWAVLVPFVLGWAYLAARDVEVVGDTVGIAALVVGNIAVLILLIARSAAELSRYDQTRELAREALRVSEERFRTALEGSAIIVFNHDRDLRYTWMYHPDPAFDTSAVIGLRDRDVLDRADEAGAVEQFKRRVIDTGIGGRREFRVTLAESTRHLDVRAEPLRDAGGEIVGITCAAVDVTEHRRAEEALRHTQKLESLGVLAGGIAHDFNNLLTGILGNAALALQSLSSGDSVETVTPLLNDVIRASERAADLTRQLLAYAGKGQFVIEPVDLGQLVADLLPLVRASVPRGVELQLLRPPELARVDADPTQLQQLVMNLVINGAEAIAADGGTVTVTLGRRVTTEPEPADAGTELAAGSYVTLEVRDTGAGMPPETVERMFDPFFTTKFLGRGLGLAAAQGIVRSHHGAIRVTSGPGEGTTFLVLFPESTVPAPAAGRVAEPPAGVRGEEPAAPVPVQVPAPNDVPLARPAGGRGSTILVVEDEPIIRTLARTALEDAGYRVLVAEHGADALELVVNDRGMIAAVVLDATMPVMNGAEAAARIRELRPSLPIIVSSGYSEEDTLPQFAAVTSHFLQKPFGPQALTDTVGRVLEAGTAGVSRSA